ncbi:DUF5666 domain-containing protein [Nocardia sp. NBC_01329]|uniref:DUF5666 domain-containing protein n=1 Tax=Nocardia sp. NBC_01329 TaxID=2903594 RepID=UPI002E1465D4|nr:DUF5666 domain-containing protein [Nocardia sp. NBC_01329]
MTNPNDPWARRPDDDPTQHLGQPGESATEKLSTGYGQAGYGESTTAYPGNDPYGGWGPGPNPTREMPAYPGGAYESPWGGYGPPGQVPPGQAPPGPPRPPKKNGMWIGVVVAVIVLIGLAGIAAGMLFGGDDSDTTASDTTTSSRPTGRGLPADPGDSGPGIPGLPGAPDLPDTGDAEAGGTTMGTISANSGGTLTISTLTGSEVTVHTTASTQVISLAGTTVDALPTGDLVIVQGQKSPDGSIQADVIISTALEGGGR